MARSRPISGGCGCRAAAQGVIYSPVNYTPPAYMTYQTAPLTYDARASLDEYAASYDRRPPYNNCNPLCQKPCCLPGPYPTPPYYDGPCPPPPGGYPPPVPLTAHAYYAQLGSLGAPAGGDINLASIAEATSGISRDGAAIILASAGRYLATFNLNIPAGEAVDTTLSLSLNGVTVPGSVTRVVAEADSETHYVSFQTMVNAPGNSTLLIKTSSALSLAGASNAVIASLTLLRLI